MKDFTKIILQSLKGFSIYFIVFFPLFSYIFSYLVIAWFFSDFIALDGAQTDKNFYEAKNYYKMDVLLQSILNESVNTYAQSFMGPIDNFIFYSLKNIPLHEIAAFSTGYLYFFLLFSIKEIIFLFLFLIFFLFSFFFFKNFKFYF